MVADPKIISIDRVPRDMTDRELLTEAVALLRPLARKVEHLEQIAERTDERSSKALRIAETTHSIVIDIKASVGNCVESLGGLMAVTSKLEGTARTLASDIGTLRRDASSIKKRLGIVEETAARAEKKADRQDSLSDAGEKFLQIKLDEEVTEVKAKKDLLEIQSDRRRTVTEIAKMAAKWLFLGGGAAILGGLIARGCG